MCQTFHVDASIVPLLLSFDRDLAAATQATGCPSCGGPLHVANYLRKPRGLSVSDPEACARLSFACGSSGCRRRATPPSIRFLGRRVYSGVLVVLLAAMRQGPNPRRARVLRDEFGVDRRTLERWSLWWREHFAVTPCWRDLRSRLMLHGSAEHPLSIVDSFDARSQHAHQAVMLAWLSPLSTILEFSITLIEGVIASRRG